MNELENVKVGDLMIVSGGSAFGECLREVERVTKSQIVVNDKRRYRKKDGRLVGGVGWFCSYIRPATEKDIDFFNKVKQKNKLIAFIKEVAWCNLSLDSLQTICDVVKKEIGNSAEQQ